MIKCAEIWCDLPESLQSVMECYNVFYSKEYYNAMRHDRKVLYIYNEHYVLMVELRKQFIFKFIALPTEAFQYDGIFNPVELKGFWNDVIQHIQKVYKVHWIGPTAATALNPIAPSKCLKIPFGSHIIDLRKTEDELWKGVHSKHRNSVRHAERAGVSIVVGGKELLPDYLIADSDTQERSSRKGRGGSYYESIFNALPNNSVIFVAYYNELPQGGAILSYNDYMSYYLHGASVNNPESGAMNLVQWEAIKYMKNKGVKYYSFVGCRINEDEDSKYHGIQRFKERFGGKLVNGYMFKIILNKPLYVFYKLIRNLKLKKKINAYLDPIEEELHKWSNLNEETD